MKGFSVAVSRSEAQDAAQIGSLHLTTDGACGVIYLAVRHADGTVLTVALEDRHLALMADALRTELVPSGMLQ